MSENEKKILQKAVKQIEVPEEALTALEIEGDQRRKKHLTMRFKWGEIIISAVLIVCVFFIGNFMWSKENTPSKSSALASTENTKTATNDILQSARYWKVKNEETYYSFSKESIRIIKNFFTIATANYTVKNDQLTVFFDTVNDNGDPIKETHSYQLKTQGNQLLLEPDLAGDQQLVLDAHQEEIFPYTEESIKKLQPAINPDLTAYTSWTSIIKGNNGLNSTVTFDGFLRKEKIDGENTWLTTTYEINNNKLLINYGGYTVGADMYWDGDKIILWQTSNTLEKDEDREQYLEELVTVLQPNK